MNIIDWIKSKHLLKNLYEEHEMPKNALAQKVNPVHVKGWMNLKKFTDGDNLTTTILNN